MYAADRAGKPFVGQEKGVRVLRAGATRKPLDRLRVCLIVALAAGMVAFGGLGAAQAFDFFGLWGSDEAPAAVSPTAIAYAVTIDIAGGDGGLKNAVQDSSALYRLRKDPPPDGEALARRAQSDFGPIIDALWGAGYYNSTVAISIDGARLSIGAGDIAAFARAAKSYRNRAAAPVAIKVDPGPLFKLSAIRVVGPGGAAFTDAELPPRIVILKPGDPAVAASLRAAQTRIIDYFRSQSRPLANGVSIAPVVDHSKLTMDVTFTGRSGPDRAVRRGDDDRPAQFRPGDRPLLPLHPAGRPLFAPRARRRAKLDPGKTPASRSSSATCATRPSSTSSSTASAGRRCSTPRP